MPRTPITAVIHFSIRGKFSQTYRELLQKRARQLHIKGWLGLLPEDTDRSAEILVGIACGDPMHIRLFADSLVRHEDPTTHVLDVDCFRWDEDISDYEQALITYDVKDFVLK